MRKLIITTVVAAALALPTVAMAAPGPIQANLNSPAGADMHADVTTEGQFKGNYVGEYASRATHNGGTLSAAAHNGDTGVQYALSLQGIGSDK